MSSSTPSHGSLSDLVARCVLAYERDGDPAIESELAACPDLAAEARQQLTALRQSGLLSPPSLPDHFGAYRVVRRLGSGGMGTVWLCEQELPIRREVAVKVMRAGLDHGELLARFMVERQAMARLTDPCIARVLDSGLTPDHRPFLVMDYVPGVAITQFCDARSLTITQRLRIFAQVCDAVQHAHHKGILHRDLKPSNVLVVERDGEPLPVIIDFGVAKCVKEGPHDVLRHTLPGRLLGTPEYMSPEQALGDGDVDTRTDVYSLGALLYELLTGCLPIDSRQFRNLADVGRVLQEVEPMRLCARLACRSEAERSQRAEHCGTTPLALMRTLRGELEWITSRAMAKQRDARYSTSADLAQDVRRYLAREPISAGPPSRWYALRKFCSRHRLPLASLAALGVALAAMTAVSLWFWRDAAAAERVARASNVSLEQNLDSALLALDRMVALGAEGLRTPGSEPMRRELLAMALDLHARLSSGGATAPRLTAALASALGRSAQLHQDLGELASATQQLERAEQALQSLGEPLPDAACLQVAQASLLCGKLRTARGDLERARDHFQTARQVCERGAGEPFDTSPTNRAALAAAQIAALRELADLLTATDAEGARNLLRETMPLAEQLLARPDAPIDARATALLVFTRLAWSESESHDPKNTLAHLQRAIQGGEALLATNQDLPQRLLLMPVFQQVATVSLRMHEIDLAQRALTTLQATLRAAIEAEPAVAAHRFNLAKALMSQSLIDGDRLPLTTVVAKEEEALRLQEQASQELGNPPDLRVWQLGNLLDYALRRLDWYQDERYRAAVDLDLVARRIAAAADLWNSLPAAYQHDRHARESWLCSFALRATLSRFRKDLTAVRAAHAEGIAFAQAMLLDHPDIVQTRLMRADLCHTSALAEIEAGDPQRAWQQELAQLEDLRDATGAFPSKARWPRLGERLPRNRSLLRQLLGHPAPNSLPLQAAALLVDLAAAADRASSPEAAEGLRHTAVECLAASRQNGLPPTELAAERFSALRPMPAFQSLLR